MPTTEKLLTQPRPENKCYCVCMYNVKCIIHMYICFYRSEGVAGRPGVYHRYPGYCGCCYRRSKSGSPQKT